jgi:hypothetical protein
MVDSQGFAGTPLLAAGRPALWNEATAQSWCPSGQAQYRAVDGKVLWQGSHRIR